MKKLLVTSLISGVLAGSVFAQGTVNLALQTTRTARYTTDGLLADAIAIPVGNPAIIGTYGQLNITAYYASAGTASPFTASAASLIPVGWTESANFLSAITTAAGWTPSTTFTLANAAGSSTVELMFVGWSGTFSDWNSAFAAGTGLVGWTGSALSTGALAWSNGTGAPNASPPVIATAVLTGAAGYNGLVLAPIPEPSTIALAGLGAAALLIFRRRK